MDYGFLSLVPTLVVLLIALTTKRTIEALLGGSIVGFIIISQGNFFQNFADTGLRVMADPTIGWIILVCGLFGSIIAMLVRSGGALAFGNFVVRFVKNRSGALVVTWLLGIVVFIDDYLNAITVGSVMQKVTDRFKISREMLAYVVDSTGATVCILIPFSTWSIFVAGLIDDANLDFGGTGLSIYISAIPFMFYAWVAILVVPLVAIKIIPALFAMKKAEDRAINTGQTIPTGSENEGIAKNDVIESQRNNPKFYNFFIPLLSLIFFTIYFDIDAYKGVLIATAITIILYSIQRMMSVAEIFDTAIEGFKSMIYPLAIVVSSFILKDVNDSLHLTEYVINGVKPIISPAFLPALIFIVLAAIAFSTGSFWGLFAISLPIIIPLAIQMDVNLSLAIGSVISAGAFGSHACFYADATVLSAKGSGCKSVDHAITQLPYVLISAAIATVLFIIAGFLIR
jgi:tetracycline resistance efflux pump